MLKRTLSCVFMGLRDPLRFGFTQSKPLQLFHTCSYLRDDEKAAERKKRERPKDTSSDTKAITKLDHFFDDIPAEQRNKETFEKAIGLFLHRNIHRRGQVEFIYAALKQMKEFGVHENLDVYKKLLNVFPKGKMVAQNLLQQELWHYQKHQMCAIKLLDQIEKYCVYPDKELYLIVENIFGKGSFAMRKMYAIIYWMPKFKNLNPYKAPRPLPQSASELAKLAMKKMCRDPANVIHVWYTEALPDPPEKTWIVCGQSPEQKEHLADHSEAKPIYVDGPFREWVGDQNLSYFTLVADPRPDMHFSEIDNPEPETADDWANWTTKFSHELPDSRKELMLKPTIHEQTDGTILSMAITGTSTKESLVCWINFLQKLNPKLEKIPVVFRMRHGGTALVVQDEKRTQLSNLDKIFSV